MLKFVALLQLIQIDNERVNEKHTETDNETDNETINETINETDNETKQRANTARDRKTNNRGLKPAQKHTSGE